MSEWVVFEWLKNKRVMGDNKYYSTKEISKSLKAEKGEIGYNIPNVRRKLINLRDKGFLDSRLGGKITKDKWHIKFRCLSIYVNK